MVYTNINITDVDDTYQYVVGYEKAVNKTLKEYPEAHYISNYITGSNENHIIFKQTDKDIVRNGNIWCKNIYNNDKILNKKTAYLPISDGKISYIPSTIRLLFPQFSVETFNKNYLYALTAYTWICNTRIQLGSYIINRNDALACDKVLKFNGVEYYEYIDFEIPDPYEIYYSDDWKDFRENICHEPLKTNFTEGLLYFSLYPVELHGDNYVMLDSFSGAQNSVNISDSHKDHLRLHIKTNIDIPKNICNPIKLNVIKSEWESVENKPTSITINDDKNHDCNCAGIDAAFILQMCYVDLFGSNNYYQILPENKCDECDCNNINTNDVKNISEEWLNNDKSNEIIEDAAVMESNWRPAIICDLYFNNSFISIKEYIQETYNIDDDIKVVYTLVLRDNDNIFTQIDSESINTHYNFVDFGFIDKDNNDIDWVWYDNYMTNYTGQLYLQCLATIKVFRDDEWIDFIYIKSNDIPVTQEIFSYLINKENFYINLDNIDMNIYNINAVNKTVNTIYQLDNPADAKANIIQPIFFKARDASDIIIHPDVTENICINLDSFKSKVKTFFIQIEGTPFTEIGRISAGVIFKIVGAKLAKTVNQGLYYILNEDGELVTNGKYTYDR